MIFCIRPLKTSSQLAIESTYYRAVQELNKALDIVNVVKTSQEIRLLKEILLDGYQKDIFEHMTYPIILGKKVITPYSNHWLEDTKLKEITGDKNVVLKALVNDSYIQLSNLCIYNFKERNLIKEIYILPDIKEFLFKLEEKEKVKKKTLSGKYLFIFNITHY